MKYAVSCENEIRTFTVSGEVKGPDILDLGRDLQACADDTCTRVVVDLTQVPFIDSTGLGGLIYAKEVLNRSGCEMLLAGPTDYIQKLMRDCRLDRVFDIVDREK